MRKKVLDPKALDPEDRVYWMVRWLQDNRHRINEFKKGKITFDFAGPSLTARIEEVQEKI